MGSPNAIIALAFQPNVVESLRKVEQGSVDLPVFGVKEPLAERLFEFVITFALYNIAAAEKDFKRSYKRFGDRRRVWLVLPSL